MMRLAWFTHRYYPCRAGAENFGRAMVRRFVRTGNHVDVITSNAHDLPYFTNPGHKRVDAPATEWLDGARVRRFAVRHFPGQRYVGRLMSHVPHWPTRCCFASFMPLLPGLCRARGDYDAVVATAFPYTVFAYAAYRTARAARTPLVLVPFLHLSTPGDPVNVQYSRPHQIRLLREASAVVVQTDIEASAVADWGIPRARIVKLGMAVEQDDVTGGDRALFRRRLGIPLHRFAIGQLGANDPNKGTCDLVRAVAALNDARPACDAVHLVLAGAPSPAFERFAAALPVGSARWLTRTGPLADEDRRHFYAALDVFAMPSRTDSFGIVFLEAWANRLPVVAAAAGGVSEVVTHEDRGLLVPFGDVAALRDSLRRLVDDRTLGCRLGESGHAHVANEGFRWDSRFEVMRSLVVSLKRDGAPVAPWSVPGPHRSIPKDVGPRTISH